MDNYNLLIVILTCFSITLLVLCIKYKIQITKIKKKYDPTNIDISEIAKDEYADFVDVEERLREYLGLMDQMLNSISNPIFFKDPDGVYRGCNDSFAQTILFLDRQTIIGKKNNDLVDNIPDDLYAKLNIYEEKLREKNAPIIFNSEFKCINGEYREFVISLQGIDSDKTNRSGWTGVLSDVTQQNEVRKMEAVYDTAVTLSHEINQPLQTISLYIDLLKNKKPDDDQTESIFNKMELQITKVNTAAKKLQAIKKYDTVDYPGGNKIIKTE